MTIKKFICGFCRKLGKKDFVSTRAGLRKHLREEHSFTKQITNISSGEGENVKKIKRDWWIVEDFK